MAVPEENFFGDTPNWRSQQMIALWRRFTLDQRAEKLAQLFDAGRELMIAGIKLREPGIPEIIARTRLSQLLQESYKRKT